MDEMCKKRKSYFLLFYEAIREHKPVWMLENMRNMETSHWEEVSQQRTFAPSEALLYAVAFDHRAYAQYLLNQFSDLALAVSGETFCGCPLYPSHLAMAALYNRKEIIPLIIQVAQRIPTLLSSMNQGGCKHMEDGKTPLHLACEFAHTEAAVMLLGSGASPQAEDHNGMTPLDLILKQLRTSESNKDAKKLCLERLLMFMPEVRFKLKSSLENYPQYWYKILGEDMFNYLVGRNPGTLYLIAMQRILSQLPPHEFLKRLDKLPIPASLKPITQQT